MTTTVPPLAATRAGAQPRLPSAVRLSLSRAALELRSFFAQRDLVVFTFTLPVILLVIFGQVFGGDIANTGVPVVQYFTAGMIASGIMSVTFVNLGISIAVERDGGALKRLAGTPLPPAAYFAGKAIAALVIAVAEAGCTLAIGVLLLGLHLPATPGRWITFTWVLVLGIAACGLAGIAFSSLPRSAASASAVINLPYLVLSFISGVYFVFTALPASLQHVAAVFPLKWLSQGLRSVFLPGRLLAAEPARSWEHGRVALVLGAWLVVSLVLCVRTFRWLPRER
jgi:ABC-2 type transport system permease protein